VSGRVQRVRRLMLLQLLRLRRHILCLQWSRSLQRMAGHSTHRRGVCVLGRCRLQWRRLLLLLAGLHGQRRCDRLLLLSDSTPLHTQRARESSACPSLFSLLRTALPQLPLSRR